MQTFLPYKSFTNTARVLDNKRLNKQILEGYQILNVISSTDPKAGWRNHPAVKMWRGHEVTLWGYIMEMITEADRRGIKTENNLANLRKLWSREISNWGRDLPAWYNNDEVMKRVTTTHKANLYRKDPEYYYDFAKAVISPNNQPCCPTCNYYWVTHKENV